MPSFANWSGAVKAIKSVGDLKGKLKASRKDSEEPDSGNSHKENIKAVSASKALDISNPRIRFEPPVESPPSPDPTRADAKVRKARRLTPYPGSLAPVDFQKLATCAELKMSLREPMMTDQNGTASHSQSIQLTTGHGARINQSNGQESAKQKKTSMSQNIDIFEALSEDPDGESSGQVEMKDVTESE
ncbi:hypothetical protein K440DRAFT_640155 [Wilcoxina mikolae CBS 423.85]|nr:hypothetical protein K440DRAFT_640155 [Wilcoxina mikolae CBS 423.85]